MEEILVEKTIGGKKIMLQTGYFAKQAGGAVLASIGGTTVLATATMSGSQSNLPFFPLSVDYIEKFYAGARIPGSYNRREGKPSDLEILTSRLIDRPIRPLFAEGFRNEVQVIINVLNLDGENSPDIIAMMAASSALTISNIPLRKPISGVRIGRVNDEWLINPTLAEIDDSQLNLIVAGTDTAITMIEGNADELPEDLILKAVDKAHQVIKEMIALENELQEKAGKKKAEVDLSVHDPELVTSLKSRYYSSLEKAFSTISNKQEREQAVSAIYSEMKTHLEQDGSEKEGTSILHDFEGQIVRNMILEKQIRSDGRKMDEVRPIDCRTNVLHHVHGSAVFTRGQTQSLGVVTLGSSRDKQKIDLTKGVIQKSFFLHYNFPPFSVGEVGRVGATGRREIGHGMLAERSLLPVLPDSEKFDFTIRLVSEILESNGSSSMATICSGSMALMDAGVPIKSHVAGVAMGLVLAQDHKYQILTDIQGLEDHLGDMDFKVAGTKKGITGFQLDIKVEGITLEIMEKALTQAKKARLEILEKMEQTIVKPLSTRENAPKREVINIPVEKIKSLIGMGGKNIKAIVEETGSDIDIKDSGEVNIFAANDEILEKTKSLVEKYTGSPKVGSIYDGVVKRVVPFGAFIEIFSGVDGLCHISEFSKEYVSDINDLIKEGDKIKVKVKSVDDQGKIKLSLKDID